MTHTITKKVKAQARARPDLALARGLLLAREGKTVPMPQLETKDVTLFLAVKPYMSTKAQRLLDIILILINPGLKAQGAALDPVPVLTLLNLAKNMASPPPPQPPEPKLPQVLEPEELVEGEEEGTGDKDMQGGEADEGDTP